jgi:hypothetical protein
MQFARSLHLPRAGQLEFIERCACRFQMALREMKVNGCGFEVSVTEQQLYRGQVSASFHQMSSKAVSQ